MEAALKIATSNSKQSEDTLTTIRDRKLNQLYLGITGPTGSGASLVSKQLREIFELRGYEVHVIKVSDLIANAPLKESLEVPNKKTTERIIALQNKGDQIRKKSKYGIAQLICSEIAKVREERFGVEYTNPKTDSFLKALNQKIVFIFDSLKNPYEVQLLREVYKNAFYLFGLVSLESTCRQRFVGKGYADAEFHQIFQRDTACEISVLGQQVRKTLQEADIFINNNTTQADALKKKLERYVALVTKSSLITPTKDETAMHHAYVAGARSACLSRQVGAAIISSDGNLISTGCNDVPKSGGGLYTADDANDQRCYNKGQICYNDQKKNELYSEVYNRLKENLGIDLQFDKVKSALRKTRIKDLIEFSRAVHAEMDAIVRVASDSKSTTKNATLYTTTFPCHNCARHIIASGIKKVLYIEPYVKSLAPSLHDDAISLEESSCKDKVAFFPYEGVAPRRYLILFEKRGWKNEESGTFSLPKENLPPESDRMPVDSFYELELKVIKDLGQQLGI